MHENYIYLYRAINHTVGTESNEFEFPILTEPAHDQPQEGTGSEANQLPENLGHEHRALHSVDSEPISDETTDCCNNDSSDSDIVGAVLKAFGLAEQMGSSQKHLMDIILFGRDLYCKGNMDMINRWPKNYSACMQVLRNAGYKDPVTYHVCLSRDHPNLWSLLQNSEEKCKYCTKTGSIMYYYLSLSDKVRRWCSDKEFCLKMTAHWKDRSKWMNSSNSESFCEIWDGARYICIILCACMHVYIAVT